jgi:hypothetical protein
MATCNFCGAGQDEVEFIFRVRRGGMPSEICDGCVEHFHAALAAGRATGMPPSAPAPGNSAGRAAAD